MLGEGELNSLAGRGGQLGDTLLKGLRHNLDLGDSDALLGRQVLTADSGQADGLVDTGLDGLRVDNLDGGVNRGDNGDVEAGLLGNLLAVVVSISLSVSVLGRLAHGDHLGNTLLLEGDLNSLGGGGLSLGLVGVGADLVVNLLNALRADGSGHSVALLLVNDGLPGELLRCAHCLEGRGADLSNLYNILDRAVVLGLLIAIGRGRVAISWGRVPISRGGVSVGRGKTIGRGRGVRV